ncbi:MAG: polyprenyl diphosphate synthase [Candidatus Peribacteraceae bacterium]|jgi:undecaprenyl diphosphate synthase
MATETPLHVAIIPDGNRRWARAQNLNPWKGHEQAIENFRKITEWCQKDPRVNVLTVWCFSTENWKRDKKEIDKLMTMLERYLEKEWKGFLKNHTRFCHSGRRDRLPTSLVNLMEKVEKETEKETDFTLNLAVDYGGKDELLRAIKKMGNDISENELKKHLDHPELPDMDLIIRTSGEQRTSNFALWQSTYAEWEFSKKLFPDFSVDDLAQAVKKFAERSRRFGA